MIYSLSSIPKVHLLGDEPRINKKSKAVNLALKAKSMFARQWVELADGRTFPNCTDNLPHPHQLLLDH
ncbi:MAG TPA: hypothetical protein VK612_06765, partial [Pyrinomonadaceae bacterium]|nr:hypothetical protein [Pyrinomonadaceae bacterium]